MANLTHEHRRAVLNQALRDLIQAARIERSLLSMEASERPFFLGVEAAAEEVLHPEIASARPEGWPGAEAREFQEGYLRTASLLAAARTSAEPPLRLLLPQPT